MAWREGLQRLFRRRLRQAGPEPPSEREFPRRCRCFLPRAFVFKGPQKRRRQSGPQPAAAAAPDSQSPLSEQRHLHESRNSVCRKDLLGSVSRVPAPNSCAPLPGTQPSSHPAAPSHHPLPRRAETAVWARASADSSTLFTEAWERGLRIQAPPRGGRRRSQAVTDLGLGSQPSPPHPRPSSSSQVRRGRTHVTKLISTVKQLP